MDEKNKEQTGTGPAPEQEPEEPIVYATRRHWAMFLPAFMLLFLAGLSLPSAKGPAVWIVAALSIAWIVIASRDYQRSRFRLTKTRILINIGALRDISASIPFSEVVNIDLYQPALGKLLDFGKVRVICTDGKARFLKLIRAPHIFMARVSELRAAMQEESK